MSRILFRLGVVFGAIAFLYGFLPARNVPEPNALSDGLTIGLLFGGPVFVLFAAWAWAVKPAAR